MIRRNKTILTAIVAAGILVSNVGKSVVAYTEVTGEEVNVNNSESAINEIVNEEINEISEEVSENSEELNNIEELEQVNEEATEEKEELNTETSMEEGILDSNVGSDENSNTTPPTNENLQDENVFGDMRDVEIDSIKFSTDVIDFNNFGEHYITIEISTSYIFPLDISVNLINNGRNVTLRAYNEDGRGNKYIVDIPNYEINANGEYEIKSIQVTMDSYNQVNFINPKYEHIEYEGVIYKDYDFEDSNFKVENYIDTVVEIKSVTKKKEGILKLEDVNHTIVIKSNKKITSGVITFLGVKYFAAGIREEVTNNDDGTYTLKFIGSKMGHGDKNLPVGEFNAWALALTIEEEIGGVTQSNIFSIIDPRFDDLESYSNNYIKEDLSALDFIVNTVEEDKENPVIEIAKGEVPTNIVKKDEAGNIKYKWTINSDTNTNYVLNPIVTNVAPEKVQEGINKLDKNAVVLNFEHSGKLPKGTKFTYYIGKELAGKEYTLYYYNETTNKAEKKNEKIKVDENGYVTIEIDHCSTYFFVKNEVKVNPTTPTDKGEVKPNNTITTTVGKGILPETGSPVSSVISLLFGGGLSTLGLSLMKKKKVKLEEQ